MQKRCGVKFALYGHYIVALDGWNLENLERNIKYYREKQIVV